MSKNKKENMEFSTRQEAMHLLPIATLDLNFLSINLWDLSIAPSQFWVFDPNMRAYNDIHCCSLFIKISHKDFYTVLYLDYLYKQHKLHSQPLLKTTLEFFYMDFEENGITHMSFEVQLVT